MIDFGFVLYSQDKGVDRCEFRFVVVVHLRRYPLSCRPRVEGSNLGRPPKVSCNDVTISQIKGDTFENELVKSCAFFFTKFVCSNAHLGH